MLFLKLGKQHYLLTPKQQVTEQVRIKKSTVKELL